MGFMLFLLQEQQIASNMSGNPNKKIKLDFHHNDGSMGNEDLWGQDDLLTAEEFDMLEIQATQACNQSYMNNALPTSTPSKQNNFLEADDMKQLQYELEGRVKILSESLEKSSKELNDERLNREQIINQRIGEFYEREAYLQKEVEKMQSILEFKEQEMKSVYSKLQIAKSQMQNQKDVPKSVDFDCFSKSSSVGDQSPRRSSAQISMRKHKLSVDTPKGKVKGAEILSSVLCTRIPSPPPRLESESKGVARSSNSTDCIPVSIVYLKNGLKSEELLQYYSSFLRDHVFLLKTQSTTFNSNKSPPLSTKLKKASYSKTVISCLCDITYTLSCSSPATMGQTDCFIEENSSEDKDVGKNEEISSCHHSEEKLGVDIFLPLLIESLLALSNPKTYPAGYYKNEEMEFSLAALFSVCLSCPTKFLDLICELPCHFLSHPHQSVAGLCVTLKLITALCSSKKFISHLEHNSNCLLCLISAFLLGVVPDYPEKFATCVILVEDFLSSVFSVHDLVEAKLETSNCTSEVIQGLIKSMWRYYQAKEKISLSTNIIKKGFLVLHFMACSLPNFKEKRSQVEDEYVSLISGMLTFYKENWDLREFYDLFRGLWDFQSDGSEFDLEDLSEELMPSTNGMDAE